MRFDCAKSDSAVKTEIGRGNDISETGVHVKAHLLCFPSFYVDPLRSSFILLRPLHIDTKVLITEILKRKCVVQLNSQVEYSIASLENGKSPLTIFHFIRYGEVGCIHKYPMMIWTHQLSCCESSILLSVFKFTSLSVEFKCAQAVGVSTFSSSLQSILHGRFENL
jgi:hypothetical protein